MPKCDCKECSADIKEICKPETEKCRWCGKEIILSGEECFACWEVRIAIKRNPEIAKKIFNELGYGIDTSPNFSE